MRRFLSGIALAMISLVSGPLAAQTSSNGPYYATPSWDQTLLATQRFIVLSNFNNEAVLDRETGLVWQKDPGTQNFFQASWFVAQDECAKAIGGRFGWRLPAAEELSTLWDPSTGQIFSGAPFSLGQLTAFWTTTTSGQTPTEAFVVQSASNPEFIITISDKPMAHNVWCVRGHQGSQSPQPAGG